MCGPWTPSHASAVWRGAARYCAAEIEDRTKQSLLRACVAPVGAARLRTFRVRKAFFGNGQSPRGYQRANQMNHSDTVHVQISALADGQLQEDELAQAIGTVCSDEELRATWRTYQLVGEVLRSGVHPPCSDTSDFLARFQQRLAAEPSATDLPPEALRAEPRAEVANEPAFRWKLVAGFASLAAAAAIGWNWVSGAGAGVQPAAPQLAQQQGSGSVLSVSRGPPHSAASPLAPTQVVIGTGAPQVMPRDTRLDQLLEAHQQAGGASEMPSGFLRNATLEGPWR